MVGFGSLLKQQTGTKRPEGLQLWQSKAKTLCGRSLGKDLRLALRRFW